MKRILVSAGLGACLALAPAAGQESATQEQRLVVPLTDPSRPVFLEASVVNGGITVRAHEGAEVVVEARAGGAPQKVEKVGTMFRIPNTSLGLTVEEKDNRVSVDLETPNRNAQVTIRVPARTSVSLSAVNGGDLVVEGLTGELELENVNGGITATGIRGAVVASTTNGPVKVSFAEVAAGKPMSFASFNGPVDVTFPPSLKATLLMTTAQGEILTDFEVQLDRQGPRVERDAKQGRYRVSVENDVRGTVGGGGPEYRFETYNGSIYVRKGGS